ncbi:hypothetical protein ABPG74_009549 [Tetrahymena malaccensis]
MQNFWICLTFSIPSRDSQLLVKEKEKMMNFEFFENYIKFESCFINQILLIYNEYYDYNFYVSYIKISRLICQSCQITYKISQECKSTRQQIQNQIKQISNIHFQLLFPNEFSQHMFFKRNFFSFITDLGCPEFLQIQKQNLMLIRITLYCIYLLYFVYIKTFRFCQIYNFIIKIHMLSIFSLQFKFQYLIFYLSFLFNLLKAFDQISHYSVYFFLQFFVYSSTVFEIHPIGTK